VRDRDRTEAGVGIDLGPAIRDGQAADEPFVDADRGLRPGQARASATGLTVTTMLVGAEVAMLPPSLVVRHVSVKFPWSLSGTLI